MRAASRGIELLLKIKRLSPDELRQLAQEGYLYAILDACKQPLVPPKMNELGASRGVSLFKGTAKEVYSAFAPYLVQVDGALLDWIRESLSKTPWGIFLLTNRRELAVLFAHLQPLLFPRLSDGKLWLLRFYDPRVLETYLTSCTMEQLRAFYGPVRALGIAEETGGGCKAFAHEPG